MRWTEGIYQPTFQHLQADAEFQLRENDYVFGDKKIGGNAQAIVKDRWLHHTSFLWDFSEANMSYLAMPSKRPTYRGDRPHSSFLTPLHRHLPPQCTPTDLALALRTELSSHFHIAPLPSPDSSPDTAAAAETQDTEEIRSLAMLLKEVSRPSYVSVACRSSLEPIEHYLTTALATGAADAASPEYPSGSSGTPGPKPVQPPVGIPSLVRMGPSCFNI